MTGRSIVLCERVVQAGNIEAAIGASFGPVRATNGPLLRLQRPEEVRSDWTSWTNDVLTVPGGYGLVPLEGAGKMKRLLELGNVIGRAKTIYVVAPGGAAALPVHDVLDYVGFKGVMVRIELMAEDRRSVRRAFSCPGDVQRNRRLVRTAQLRREMELVYNLTLTRVATNALRPTGLRQALGVGLVRSPVLGWLCQREIDIETFRPCQAFEVSVFAEGGLQLWHEPANGASFADPVSAGEFGLTLTGTKAKVSVANWATVERGTPWDLAAMQEAASEWGWTAARTADVARSLYEGAKLITFPGTDCRYWPRNHIVLAYWHLEK